MHLFHNLRPAGLLRAPEAAVKVGDDQLGDVLKGQHRGIEAQVVAGSVAPGLVGIEIVKIGAEFVGLLAEAAHLVGRATLWVA